ncbi:dihydroorotate dehydrogenase electron transfer subunit [Paenibacillus sp. YPG26]|uniref:dihydroorotate dehydrogenase electron transfer subunit n=1 Tax=Paenibacillus sp. YPG26 TaxID=2878915 RepID=UPI0020410290|nr:dihydroorotate dehydrogenase electron transfer subunit [Paenibacillus sp. YPG26]USB31578.1 dihydroorotate dehydrogenase electron transfer subunit [Paenibacillus sp. YPG26]
MAEIMSNIQVSPGVFRMKIAGNYEGRMGQFYMLRSSGMEPLLSRPLSIFDLQEHYIEFLYQVVGKGTHLFAGLKRGDSLNLLGPLGNGFPDIQGRVALVGGGIGTAPLYYSARQLSDAHVYLGFREETYLVREFGAISSQVHVKVGGSILDDVDFDAYDHIFVCGPTGMLKAAKLREAEQGYSGNLYVSVENKMACGIGACLVCRVKAPGGGTKRACVEGPVFLAKEVDLDD